MFFVFSFSNNLYAQPIEIITETQQELYPDNTTKALELSLMMNRTLMEENNNLAKEIEEGQTNATLLFGSGLIAGILILLGVLLL